MPSFLRSLIPTFAVCAPVTIILCQRHAGFMLLAVALPLVPWLLHSIRVIATKPVARWLQLAKSGLWILGVAIVVFVHATMFATAKKNADQVANALEAYMAKTGNCPQDLSVVGVSETELRKALGRVGYICESGKPTLFYGSTFVPFETENYNFSTHSWEHVYD